MHWTSGINSQGADYTLVLQNDVSKQTRGYTGDSGAPPRTQGVTTPGAAAGYPIYDTRIPGHRGTWTQDTVGGVLGQVGELTVQDVGY